VNCMPPKKTKGIDIGSCTGSLHGDTCQASCAAGSKGKPATMTCKVEGSEGQWVGSTPACQPVLCEPPKDVPSNINSSDCSGKKGSDAKCTLYCGSRYAGKPSQMTCKVRGDTGRWEGNYPICEEIKCPPPTAINSTTFEDKCSNLVAGQSCQASCKHKFFGDTTTLTCEVNKYTGKLIGAMPNCEPVMCELPATEEVRGMNFLDCHGLSNGGTCTAKCKSWRGYKGNDAQITCKVDENNEGFFDDLPTCNIRKTVSGSHCYFPVWYKDNLMKDDCTTAEWHTEWCFINPKTGYWGECDPKTRQSQRQFLGGQ
jgi:hypothetical protein